MKKHPNKLSIVQCYKKIEYEIGFVCRFRCARCVHTDDIATEQRVTRENSNIFLCMRNLICLLMLLSQPCDAINLAPCNMCVVCSLPKQLTRENPLEFRRLAGVVYTSYLSQGWRREEIYFVKFVFKRHKKNTTNRKKIFYSQAPRWNENFISSNVR